MSKKVVVYSINPCPFCVRAKMLLQQNNIPYEEVMVDRSDDKALQELQNKSKMRTFPQIFYGDELIGGFTELQKLHQEQGLKNYFVDL